MKNNIYIVLSIILVILFVVPSKVGASSYIAINGCGDGILYLNTGEKAQLTFTRHLESGMTIGSGNYNWYSDNTSIASVTYYDGLVTAEATGTTTVVIQAYLTIDGVTSSNHISDHCTVVVSNPVVCTDSITLNTNTATINVSESVALTATVSPSNANNSSITWTSSDPSIATVNNGVVTGLKKGNVTITASVSSTDGCEAVKVTANITVNEPIVCETDLTLDKTSASIKVLESVTLIASKTVTWTSSDPTIATVSNGVVTGLKEGKVTITATYPAIDECAEIKKTVEITVTQDRNLKLICESAIKVGDSVKLNYNYSPSDEEITYTWISSDPEIISVDTLGNIKALKFSSTPVKISLMTSTGLVDECSIELVNVIDVPQTAMNTSKFIIVVSLISFVLGIVILASVSKNNTISK